MKIEIVPNASRNPIQEGWVRLTENDFNNFESFFAKHPNITPESVDEIVVRGVLEVHPYPLIIVRHIDWLLKSGGSFSIESLFRWNKAGYVSPYYQIRYLITQGFKDRIICTKIEQRDGLQILNYEKIKSSLPLSDTIKKWSFGICSNGSQNERVMRLIESIAKQNIPEFEIIVCGPAPFKDLPSYVKVVDDAECYMKGDVRIPIAKKKNLIAKHAKYNNMCIMHDRYLFSDDWYKNMIKYGNYYDVITMKCYDVDKPEQEMPSINIIGSNSANVHSLKNIRLQTFDFPQDIYINGGFIIAKKHIYEHIPIPIHLNWAEAEDIVWCSKLPINGVLIGIDEHNSVYSYAVRIASKMVGKEKFLDKIRERYRLLRDELHSTIEWALCFNVPYKNAHFYNLRAKEFVMHVTFYMCKGINKLLLK